ncbi:MAG: Sir2 family NAD-dependent protein deacetylase [Pseudomonadales bacterium]|nr:Sir2 family NAD-dependent protein deacetylase [Pseudomonadales bacterium]
MQTALERLVAQSQRIVFFTGAGLSTESGIPDFRSPSGLWTKMKPIQFQDFIASESTRQESWKRRFSGDRTIQDALPNVGHKVVAQLINSGKATSVITQNIDNLHQDSGIEESKLKVIELHGNSTYAECLNCQKRYEMAFLEEQFKAQGSVSDCLECQGIIKSATISFGQSMPEEAMQRAQSETLACDLFIVLGSSLVVYPAANFPELAKRNGASLVIVNREETPLDGIADLVLHEEIGTCLSILL